ncbi:lysozyme inhibitor LprI family protein [Rhizobium sp. RCAM05350]|nr:lysozyme inhibitor LprI family protein [Rhizobium sp. RCAM05350]
MNYKFMFGFALFSLSVSSLASAQEDPSFDCSKAKTQVEKVLCSGGNSGMGWIDQTMADLYKAVRVAPDADAAALETSQRAWLAKRNQCKGSDEKVMNCLIDSYRARYVELSSSYDQQHLTGQFTNQLGVLDGVLFP